MMRTFLLLTIICVVAHPAITAQTVENTGDSEQLQLEMCYNYSNLFGYNIDTIGSPLLYSSVAGWLGTPYHYAGETCTGIDCSGFVEKIYYDVFHLQLPSDSRNMFDVVAPLKRAQLMEGDLVFFKIRKHRISHVGIYLGENKFVHASVHEGVTISDLDEAYYKKYFYRGGRVKSGSSK